MRCLKIQPSDYLFGIGNTHVVLLSALQKHNRSERICFIEGNTAPSVKRRTAGKNFVVKQPHNRRVVIHNMRTIAERLQP